MKADPGAEKTAEEKWNESCEAADDETKLDALETANKGDKEKCQTHQADVK